MRANCSCASATRPPGAARDRASKSMSGLRARQWASLDHRLHCFPVVRAQRTTHLPLEHFVDSGGIGADADVFTATPIPIVGFAHQPQRCHVADTAPDDAALLGRQQQVQRARVFGGVLRVVAREPDDCHHRQLTLHFGQSPLVRCQERPGPIDRLRQQFLIDRPPARIECARADALGDIELILLDQRPHAIPHRDAVVGQQCLSQRDASFTGRVVVLASS